MPKKAKPPEPPAQPRAFYNHQAWRCSPHTDGCEILAYVEASGNWETVIDVRPTSGASPEALAAYVTATINQYQNEQNLLHQAMKALEQCLEDGITFSSEQEADHVIARIKSIAG